jgi:cytochrome c556
VVIAATVSLSIFTFNALSHGGATGIVKERMDDMVAMGKAMGSVAGMIKKKTKFSFSGVSSAANTIAGHSAELGRLFPDTEASRKSPHSDALPSVWEKKAEFLALAKSLGEEAGNLKMTAGTKDQKTVRAAFAKTAKVCSACHTDFRKKKE